MPNETPEPPQSIVIGASGVLGSAIARRLCQEHRVLATYFSGEDRALALDCAIEPLDVRDEGAVESLIERVRPRSLVLCTGNAGAGLVARLSGEAWRETVRVHLDSLFWTLRAALKYLPEHGRVVWLGSRVGESGGIGQSAYAACKAEGEALVLAAAREGGACRVAFNVVCPGFVLSPLTSGLGEERLGRECARDAWGELSQAGPCAEMVAWLLSPAASGISGQVFHADARAE